MYLRTHHINIVNAFYEDMQKIIINSKNRAVEKFRRLLGFVIMLGKHS